MNHYCLKYCCKYILMNGNLKKIREIFMIFVKERLKEQGLKIDAAENQDFLLYLNESKLPKNASDSMQKINSLKNDAKCEISLFNTIINSFIKNDVDFIKRKRTKISEETSQFLLIQFRKFYKFKFLSNKCPYCFKLINNIFGIYLI